MGRIRRCSRAGQARQGNGTLQHQDDQQEGHGVQVGVHRVAILTIGIIKLEYFLLNLDWVVLEFTIIRTAAEGVKISVYRLRRLLSSLFNLANRIWDSTVLFREIETVFGLVRIPVLFVQVKGPETDWYIYLYNFLVS